MFELIRTRLLQSSCQADITGIRVDDNRFLPVRQVKTDSMAMASFSLLNPSVCSSVQFHSIEVLNSLVKGSQMGCVSRNELLVVSHESQKKAQMQLNLELWPFLDCRNATFIQSEVEAIQLMTNIS